MRAFHFSIEDQKILKTDGDMRVYVPGYEGETGKICPQKSTSRVFTPPEVFFFFVKFFNLDEEEAQYIFLKLTRKKSTSRRVKISA